jgi:DNA ligase (NAD+)
MNSPRRRIAELSIKLHEASRAYYNDDKPIMADSEFDAMMNELFELEEMYPEFIMEDSPTQTVGHAPSNRFEKIKHVKKMLSLDSSANLKKAKNWVNGLKCKKLIAQPKMDGLSMELVYRNGILQTGSTRGDGEIGEDVTSNLRFVTGIPQALTSQEPPEYLVVRGEVYINLKDFHNLNAGLIADGNDPFANPRNAAAGSLRQKNPHIAWSRPLWFYPFELVNYSDFPHSFFEATLMDKILEANGFILHTGTQHRLDANWESVQWVFEHFSSMRDKMPFEIDGVVFKVTDYRDREKMGATAKVPRWAYAIKFPPRAKNSVIRKIVYQVGRTGKITPVAVLDPVEVSGVTVSRATLHNWDEIKRLEIAIGDTVEVTRRGDVIPKVEKKVAQGKYRRFALIPAECPSCGSKITKIGANHMCTNEDCPAQLLEKLRWYVSRDAMNIQSLGDQKLEDLFKQGWVRYPCDLYRLNTRNMAQLPGWGLPSAKKVVQEINNTVGTDLAKVITALGIPGVGKVTAAGLAEKAKTLEGLLHLTTRDMGSIEGIGKKTAYAIHDHLENITNYDLVMELNELVKPVLHRTIYNGDELKGMVMVFTGTLHSMTRNKAQKLAMSHGAKITGSVSKNTSMVVAGDHAGSKKEQAIKLGVPVVSEQEFYDLVEPGIRK